MANYKGPKLYQSIEDFEREEIRPSERIGFSVDDFHEDWAVRGSDVSHEAEAPEELDFDA